MPDRTFMTPVAFDLDAMRRGLANALQGIDAYWEVDMPRGDPSDPIRPPDVVEASLTDDILTAVSAMLTGLRLLEEGRLVEAVWWWQYSCLSTWGERITAALHVIQTLLAQARATTA
jgi:hypothetical protein